MRGFVGLYLPGRQASRLEVADFALCHRVTRVGLHRHCVCSSEHEARVRWRCSQPPLHVQRCGGAERRPAPNTPMEQVDLSCWQPCHACHGTLQVLCPHCDGEGSLPIELQFLDWVRDPHELQCEACSGCGFLACQECQSQGFIPRWNEAETAEARAARIDN